MRAKAIKTINATYKKIIQILQEDKVFYGPILRSLDNDMEDQRSFINYILYLGRPAIVKFNELNIRYRKLHEISQKNLQSKIQMLNHFTPVTVMANPPKLQMSNEELASLPKPAHYVRRTETMESLKFYANLLEYQIKQLKLATFCSQAKEIYPR